MNGKKRKEITAVDSFSTENLITSKSNVLSPVSQEEINLPFMPLRTLYQQVFQFTLKGFEVYIWIFPVAKEIRIAGL